MQMKLSLLCLLVLLHKACSFHSLGANNRFLTPLKCKRSGHTRLNMVFDFIRKRSEEGIAQVQNIATKTAEGKLSEALLESRDYVRERQKIDAENLSRLTSGLARSRERLLGDITGVFSQTDLDVAKRLESLENVLLQADIGASTTNAIISDLRQYAMSEDLKEEDILPVLRERLVQALTPPEGPSGLLTSPDPEKPSVIFVIGANGMGKTTTIGKIASRLRNEGNATVLLGACDTFRAAAVEQLGEWAKRANVSIEMPYESETGGGDPVPVVTRSLQRAQRESFDVVIIDTSGRLSNNFELTEQLQNMKAAIQAENPAAPHETLLVVDGSLGRNAVEQATAWRKYVGVTGLAITKLDGTARGGFVVSVVKDLGLPVKFIGVGEKIEDLRDFQPDVFVDALLGNDEQRTIQLKAKATQILDVSKANQMKEDAETAAAGKSSNRADGGGGGGDAASRLRASFEGGAGAGGDSDIISPEEFAKNMAGGAGKPKRAKRVKPAAAKKAAKNNKKSKK